MTSMLLDYDNESPRLKSKASLAPDHVHKGVG